MTNPFRARRGLLVIAAVVAASALAVPLVIGSSHREAPNISLVESGIDEWRNDSAFHRRLQSGPVLAQIIDVCSDEDDLVGLSRVGERLNGIVQCTLAEIAAVSGVGAISRELHLFGFHFFHTCADPVSNPMCVGALRRRE